MKKTLFYSALIAALTASGVNYARADERLLQKHHQRMKQRLSNPQNQRTQPPMPYYQGVPGTVIPSEPTVQPQIPYYENTAPSQLDPSVPPSQAPAPILTPSEVGIPPNQPSIPAPDINNFADDAPEGRFTSNNAIDTRGLLANDRTGSPLSGPLNTIGDFFGPACQNVTFGAVTQGQVTVLGDNDPNTFGLFAENAGNGFVELSDGDFVSVNGVIVAYDIEPVTSTSPVGGQFGGVNSDTLLALNAPTSFAVVGDAYPQGMVLSIQQVLGSGDVVLGNFLARQIGTDIDGGDTVAVYSAIQDFTFLSSTNFSTLQICASPGAQTGRLKLADNNSPLPRDRVFLDYSFFHNAILTNQPSSVNRYAPGFEKTFFDGMSSLEVRAPMALTLNSTTTADGTGGVDVSHYEFGNLSFALKQVLLSRQDFWLTAGLGIQTPTADDVRVNLSNGTELVRVRNQSVRLQPYLATLHQRNKWFWQNYIQVDVAANGNSVEANSGNGLTSIGKLSDQNYLYLDTSLSRWMYRDFQNQFGFALTGELHYNKSIQSADVVSRGSYIIGNPGFQADILNATFGATTVLGKTFLTTAYGTPITSDRGFDGEFRVLLNRLF